MRVKWESYTSITKLFPVDKPRLDIGWMSARVALISGQVCTSFGVTIVIDIILYGLKNEKGINNTIYVYNIVI